jgi:hypothetical protein
MQMQRFHSQSVGFKMSSPRMKISVWPDVQFDRRIGVIGDGYYVRVKSLRLPPIPSHYIFTRHHQNYYVNIKLVVIR